MGKNKNTFRAAVGEMKHFLLGSALVLALVTVVPVLAAQGGMGGGMGGGNMGGGMGGGQQMGGQKGGMSGGQGQMNQQMGNQLKQMMNQGGMNSDQAGQLGKMMNQMNQMQGQQGMGQGQQGGMGMNDKKLMPGMKQTGTSGLNGSANETMDPAGQEGMGMGQGSQQGMGMGQYKKDMGQGMMGQQGQMNKKMMNQKKQAPKPMDATKFTKSYDKVLVAITKAKDQFAAKAAKIPASVKNSKKIMTLVNTAIKNDVKFCKVTQTPMIPLELDVENFDCQGYLEEQMTSFLDLRESYLGLIDDLKAAETTEEKAQLEADILEVLTSATDIANETFDQFTTTIEELRTAIEDAIEADNAAKAEEANIIEEEQSYDTVPATEPVTEPAPTTDTTNTGM